MRCAVGDLAYLDRNTSGLPCYAGLVHVPVVCTRLVGVDPFLGPLWRTKQAVPCPVCGRPIDTFLDADLRPIRGAPERLPTVGAEPIEAESYAHA